MEIKNLKPAGIVRRIDDLGRIVIPKEIRRTFMINEGDPLEIFTSSEKTIYIRKYDMIDQPMGIVDSLEQSINGLTCITDESIFNKAAMLAKIEEIKKLLSEEKQNGEGE